jgi:hypothetical protein
VQHPFDSPETAWRSLGEEIQERFCRLLVAGPVEFVKAAEFPLVTGAANRVGRLRGYGNSIVAPVATEFIRAYMT